MAVNYGELKEEVRTYLYNRKDLTAQIPTFISFGEQKIFRQFRQRENEKMESGDLSLDPTGFTLPDDFLEMKFLLVNGKPMERKSEIEYLSRLNVDDAAGEPSWFARILNEIKLWREADADYSYEFVYWYTQAGDMVDDADSTPALLLAPDAYLYAALIEAMPYLVKDERITTWQAMFSQCMDELDHLYKEGEYAGSNVSVSSPYNDGIRGAQSGRRQ